MLFSLKLMNTLNLPRKMVSCMDKKDEAGVIFLHILTRTDIIWLALMDLVMN